MYLMCLFIMLHNKFVLKSNISIYTQTLYKWKKKLSIQKLSLLDLFGRISNSLKNEKGRYVFLHMYGYFTDRYHVKTTIKYCKKKTYMFSSIKLKGFSIHSLTLRPLQFKNKKWKKVGTYFCICMDILRIALMLRQQSNIVTKHINVLFNKTLRVLHAQVNLAPATVQTYAVQIIWRNCKI